MSEDKKHEDHTERARAYTKATTALRKAHRDEFAELLAAEYAARGLSVRPRLSPEEKAAKAALAIAAKAEKAAAKKAAKVAALEAQIEALSA